MAVDRNLHSESIKTEKGGRSNKKNTSQTSNQRYEDRGSRVRAFQRTLGNQAIQELVKSGRIQPSLSVSSSSDHSEREANQVAAEVTAMSNASAPVSVNRKSPAPNSDQISEEVERDLRATSGGRPLPETVRSEFESRFGVDFSDVRVHTGAKSDGAARAIGANAFTIGRDIVFRNGRYAPRDAAGKRLLAHELTHVVQQDHTREIAQRDNASSDTSERDRTWAQGVRNDIEYIQRTLRTAEENLTADARAAIEHIRRTQTSYNAFENRFNTARDRLVSQMGAERLRSQQIEQNVSFLANMTLAVAFPTFAAMKGAAEGVLNKVQGVSRVFETAEGQDPGGGEPPEVETSPRDVDWSELLTVTLEMFDRTLRENAELNELGERCRVSLAFVNRVLSGEANDDPRSTPQGGAAIRLSNNVSPLVSSLERIGSGEISEPAESFANRATQQLDDKGVRTIKQELLIHWIASLPQSSNIEEIADISAVIEAVGLTDSENSRWNFDIGMYTSDVDENQLWQLASVETQAMGLVGQTVEWAGMFTRGVGSIRDSRGRIWLTNMPPGISEQAGGMVRVNSYYMSRLTRWSDELSYGSDQMEAMRWSVTLNVTPIGETGGGMTAPGPSVMAR